MCGNLARSPLSCTSGACSAKLGSSTARLIRKFELWAQFHWDLHNDTPNAFSRPGSGEMQRRDRRLAASVRANTSSKAHEHADICRRAVCVETDVKWRLCAGVRGSRTVTNAARTEFNLFDDGGQVDSRA
mmetsp:Transcript_12540/g.43877  ORF Transcript_12540/g.43877 Transcript_12540/m.43877 type:complete len:130 (+) Transcript_12540:123-512(+)